MNKTLQVVMLPTDQKSKLFSNVTGDILGYDESAPEDGIINQHLYLVSTEKREKIKQGEWMHTHEGIEQAGYDGYSFDTTKSKTVSIKEFCLKIIATTNPSLKIPVGKGGDMGLDIAYEILIAPSIPQIPDNFIKQYVDVAGKIDEVEVEYIETLACTEGKDCPTYTNSGEKCNGTVVEVCNINTTANNTIIIHKAEDYWKNEMEKCKESPYYFFKNYWKVDGKTPTTFLTELEFNKEWKKFENL